MEPWDDWAMLNSVTMAPMAMLWCMSLLCHSAAQGQRTRSAGGEDDVRDLSDTL